MFIKIFLISIIIFIIAKQLIDSNKELPKQPITNDEPIQIQTQDKPIFNEPTRIIKEKNNSDNIYTKEVDTQLNEVQAQKPWSRVLYNENNEYPYYFYIKLKIPSLNDYEKWKEIIPNIDFNPNTREIVIPSKDEASALAVANLMCMNFSGSITMKEILSKDLIRVSITKAQGHDIVKEKLREQINDTLNGKITVEPQQIKKQRSTMKNDNKSFTLKSENFRDTFEHFDDNIGAFDNNGGYSFI
jgi:hypothetical protein